MSDDPTDRDRQSPPLPDEAAELVVQLGAALVASGAPVDYVEDLLTDVSGRYGIDFGYSVLPTGLIALGRDGSSTVASISGTDPATYRFNQITSLFELLDEILSDYVEPADGIERLRAIRKLRPRFPPPVAIMGHVVLTVGLALLLEPTLPTIGLAALLGAFVGVLKVLAAGRTTLLRLLPVLAAFLVALFVFTLRSNGVEVDGLKLLIPPLVTFLPGAMLTVGAVELTSGSIVAGSSRLIAGSVQVLLLALGIVAAASIVDVPTSETLIDAARPHLGPWAPWVGVLLFGVGAAVYFSASIRTYPALIVVLYVAYAGQVAANELVGTYASGFVGALLAVVAASLLHRHANGPPVLVTFLPAFWLLVPGVLSVVGITRIAVGDAATEEVATAVFTILSVALGVVAGLGLSTATQKKARGPEPRR